jgi:hypothetical protein
MSAVNSVRISTFPVVVTSASTSAYFVLTDASDVLTTTDEIRFRLEQAFNDWKDLYAGQGSVDDVDLADGQFDFEDKALRFFAQTTTIAYMNGGTITTEVEGSEE